ncbi:GMC family oxidoreductase [Bosea sp. F3-2]|uniref:GMC family oxidoreductase n=1 Tax=Bosea sp. F3-2 TaxID=2599640 RepID=UPI0011EEE5BD|nr:GMC family oxidoreductase [Bosea sp. F3-2]QEL22920.1 GMC family oxidoreductase [Bosea sp. F3-2]
MRIVADGAVPIPSSIVDKVFDTVVIGGGTAGCVVASRLSESPNHHVLLIEAGADHSRAREPESVLDTFPRSYTDPQFTWPGLVAAQRESGAAEPFIQARVLGGGSMVMGMHALRGLPADFEEWQDAGATGWGWDGVRPYFQKLEHDLERDIGPYGTKGPIPIWRHSPKEWPPFAQALASVLASGGFARGEDVNSSSEDGLYPMPYNTHGGVRITAPKAYLKEGVRRRQNLTILTQAFVRKLLLSDRQAQAVLIDVQGRSVAIRARQFVLSAGAIQSPAILLRSGIGPASHLRECGINVAADRPGVGSNLLNHPMLRVACRLKTGKRHPHAIRPHGNSVLRYSSQKDGCPASDMLMFILGKTSWHPLGETIGALGMSVYKSYSRGEIRLNQSADQDLPKISFRLLSDERDLERMTDAFGFAAALLAHDTVSPMISKVFVPGKSPLISRLALPGFRNHLLSYGLSKAMDIAPPLERWLIRLVSAAYDAAAPKRELRDFVREATVGMFHPCGTCRMGSTSDPDVVVGPDGGVVGFRNLIVADASIMPTIPRANTFLSTLMIGEKISDHIACE